MRKELIERFKGMKLDCSKCPISEKDCQWMADTFQNENKPGGKVPAWCPLIVTIGNVMMLLRKL